ncbi:RbsD/FucU domain-containing protein [Serratia ficaria]|uniref:ABC-type ribose transport system, auxiliary component n=1 Tax=Serratia ficaria TaxID=61651 RepID=A0A240C5S7_SERFI|nr:MULTISPECIES: RbsD/FucU domain-containing protein [Serratia]MEE4481675.1 RbsD/FucU domain-containing protein [Serratia ficaria]REF44183.1 L-fucose mutarotase [Serratia ficaria]CAI0746943.1 ABC-type ribose transport system, auxiliary component [Serratia ficaria]CAI0752656.1 ABC-type ribose transport system, auxiliary component [Serratia ficaria]CAI0766995.1 ABC-type ribose transport system, auxiliary component [Serratia ficaria]
MIKSDLIHPQLLCALAQCGHKSQLLIADGNYACVTNAPKDATRVYLNLSPGTLAAPLILEKILTCINVESAALMACPPDFINGAEAEYRRLLPASCAIEHLAREDFYAAVKSDRTLLVIASGERRRFANLLLTVAPVA